MSTAERQAIAEASLAADLASGNTSGVVVSMRALIATLKAA